MRMIFAGTALAAFVVTPAFADYYIVQEPITKRCKIVEERPVSPSVGTMVGGAIFSVRTDAESYMRIVDKCQENGTTGSGVIEECEPVRER